MGERNDKVFSLLKEQGKTKSSMAKALNVSRSAISQWEKNGTDPTFEQCLVLSDFFDIPMSQIYFSEKSNEVIQNTTPKIADAILHQQGYENDEEKEWTPALTEKDEKDLDKKVENLLNAVDSDTGLMLDGEIMDEETREIFAMNLKNALRTTKLAAKAKYTPNKYRK